MRRAAAKPLFFSYFANQFEGVGASTADGITYGWYPTGLVNQIP
ncbi:MAG: hypothetical protein M5U09_19070 [Gammaproteobacteria bacterium]|nr:hypothetical protein [Gammaproteobacteria bacterium]